MHDIHTYIPETKHVSRLYSVAGILRLLLMVHITLSSILNSLVLLQYHFPKYVRCAQSSCFLYFLDIVISRYAAQMLSEGFWNGSSCSYYNWRPLCFYTTHALYYYYVVFIIIIIIIIIIITLL
jgi:type IV secretory pathway VirB3-like protein